MLKRLIVGIVLGLVIGGAAAALLVKGLGIAIFPNAFTAYAAAAVTGVVCGLIAGKPIWSQGGRIEAGLKAVFGALLAAGAMFALRTWVHMTLDLGALNAGAGAVAELPATALPAIAAVLSAFFELDNTPEPASGDGSKTTGKGARIAASSKARVADEAQDELDEPQSAEKRRR